MSHTTHKHHEIDYVEFTVTDMTESKRFYQAAFGWTFNDYGPNYAGIRSGEREFGGLQVANETRPGGPLVILYSYDLQATLERVRAAGGRIMTDVFVFPGGRRFHFLDPDDTELAVWSDS